MKLIAHFSTVNICFEIRQRCVKGLGIIKYYSNVAIEDDII